MRQENEKKKKANGHQTLHEICRLRVRAYVSLYAKQKYAKEYRKLQWE